MKLAAESKIFKQTKARTHYNILHWILLEVLTAIGAFQYVAT